LVRRKLCLIEAELAVQGDQLTDPGPTGVVDGRKCAVARQALVKQFACGVRRKHAAVDEQVVDTVQTGLHSAGEAYDRHAVLHGEFQTAPRPFLKDSPTIADSDQTDRLMFVLEAGNAKHHFEFRGTVPGRIVGRPRRILNHNHARRRPRGAAEWKCREEKAKEAAKHASRLSTADAMRRSQCLFLDEHFSLKCAQP
jgi:hypothetical protein